MNLVKNLENENVVIYIEGKIDSSNANEFEEKLVEIVGDELVITLDVAKLEYISSAGLRVLLTFYKNITNKNGNISIRNCTPITREIFDLTGFSSIIDFQ